MNSVNWQQIKKIFYSALEHMPAEREVFLDEACASDADLRRDVEILLDSYQSEFLEKPAVGKFDPAVIVEPQTVKIGTQINQYKIIQKLGTGGMGEVFLAEDTRLNRQVAIKFFQSASVFGAQSEHRLLREAQSAARLNHPNICTIYEIAESENGSFIVMEYIEGETLEERIQREKPTDSEIIQLVLSIADALADAHSHGIVHRDIKPSNVMLNTRGQVKVLDFSLAKKTFTENSENKASFLSESGVIAGTIAYMSPEQARGQNIDTRSDIWSLGVVLYEMLAGCQPFEGETKSDLIAAILLSEPALLRNFLTNPPAEAEQIIRRALEKNVELRYQSIEDFSNDLRRLQVIFGVSEKTLGFTALTAENATAKLSEARSAEAVNFIEITDSTVMPKTGEEKIYSIGKYPAENTRSRKFSVLLLLTVLLLGGVAFWKFGLRSTATSFFFTPELRANLKISTLFDIKRKQGSFITGLNFSPDGNLLAFSSTAEGKGSIFVKQIESEEAIKITDGKWFDNSPVWSSDGQRLAFVSNRSGNFAIWTISYLGGNPLPLPKSEVTPDTALKKWSTDGRTIYYESSGNFYALDVANGEAAKINPAIQSAIGNFNISADEKMIAYVAMENEKEQIWIQSLQDGKTKQIAAGNYHHWSPVWFPDNEHLAYCTDQNGNFQLYVSDKNQGETNQRMLKRPSFRRMDEK
jgi:serine/threonine protein kinase